MAAPLRILVVDDNPDSLANWSMLLPLVGHQVETAQDGFTALAKMAKKVEPDVVLLDIGMPDMNGWEVARLIHEQATERRPFIIAITGYGTKEALQRSHDAGIDLHLIKPVEPGTLEAVLRGLQGLKSTRLVIPDEVSTYGVYGTVSKNGSQVARRVQIVFDPESWSGRITYVGQGEITLLGNPYRLTLDGGDSAEVNFGPVTRLTLGSTTKTSAAFKPAK
jgi:CheY-like chemotaxis protein